MEAYVCRQFLFQPVFRKTKLEFGISVISLVRKYNIWIFEKTKIIINRR